MKFDAHQATHYHKHSKNVLPALIVGENVMNRVDEHSNSQSVINTTCLQKIFLTLRCITCQSLSIRGHTESEGNYIQMLSLIGSTCTADDNGMFTDWMNRKTIWTSLTVPEEMIQLMANTVISNVIQKVKGIVFYALMADETSDISNKEQLSVCVRTVGDNVEVHEYVLVLYDLVSCDAETVVDAILDVLVRFGIDLVYCRAFCSDGASTFQGNQSEVITRLQEHENNIIRTHCYMHCVNLSVQDTLSGVPMMRYFLHFNNDLITFLKGTPKRSAIVEIICKNMHCKQTHIRPLLPSRFAVKYNSLPGLSQQRNAYKQSIRSFKAAH